MDFGGIFDKNLQVDGNEVTLQKQYGHGMTWTYMVRLLDRGIKCDVLDNYGLI